MGRLSFLKAFNPQRDIDTLLVNNLAEDALGLNVSTQFLHDFDVASYSKFINEPIATIGKALRAWDFVEISERSLR
jgi:hypothetical protein